MNYTGPYVENTDDVFDPTVNPTDWLEIIDSGNSPGNTQLTHETQGAQLIGYIPWNKQRSAARWWLGFAMPTSNWTLSRENPKAHPTFPWLYAAEVNFTPFNPMVNEDNPDDPLQFVSPFFGNGLVEVNIANHRLAICTVRLKSFRYSFLDDTDITDPRMEWKRNVYIDLDPSVEALSADGVGQLTFVETSAAVTGPPVIPAGPALADAGPPVFLGTPFPAPLAELLNKATYTLNWMNVPFEFLSNEEDYFFPANIIACLGKVNSDEFPYGSSDPFQPGQLLFDAVKFTQKVFPVSCADPSTPLISIDVSMSFKFFNPPKGKPESSYMGHNLMPWRDNGLWYYATRGDGNNPPSVNTPPLLASAPFANLFLSPN